MKKRYFFVLVFFIFSLALFKCKPPEQQKYEIYRFTDNTMEKNVIESPLKGLINRFNLVRQELTGKWSSVPSLSTSKQAVWGISSQFKILGLEESRKPDGMKLTQGKKEIPFIGEEGTAAQGWKWLKGTRKIELSTHKKYNRLLEGLVCREGKPLKIENLLLPEGEITLNFFISRINCKDSTPRLIVKLNDETVKKFQLNKSRFISLKTDKKFGITSIEFKLPVPKGRGKNPDNYVVIDYIGLESSKDIILLYTPGKDNTMPPSEKIQTEYYTLFSEPEQKIDLSENNAYTLYRIKEEYSIHDLGIEKNPYSTVIKARIGEYSINSLFAPPRTRFRFEVKIPENCTLEFGYGLMNETLEESNKTIRFTVELQYKKDKRILFSEKINPFTNRGLAYAKVDLSSYSNKKVKLFFTTDALYSRKEKHSELTQDYPVWVNPILYHPDPSDSKNRVNIILVSIDTLRADHLSCYGYPIKTSPHIDLTADEGVLFQNTFSTTSWTLPAHVSLLTSTNISRHNVKNALNKLNPSFLTLADILRNHGYYCVAFTGGAYLSKRFGFAKGFDSYQEIRNLDKIPRLDEAESLYNRMSGWLNKNSRKKFMMFLHTYQPHIPYENPSDVGKAFLDDDSRWKKIRLEDVFVQKGKHHTVLPEKNRENIIALYDGEIKYTDEYLIKPMIQKLKELDIYDKTMIIITSDHGEEFYEHGNWLHGSSLYNESIKIPLIIKFPNSVYRGIKIPQIVRIIDIMPTILETAGIDPSPFQLDGKSLLSLIRGEEREDRTFFSDLSLQRRRHDNPPNFFATNKNNLKLILSKKIKSSYIKNIVAELKGRKIELYDILKDPSEKENIAVIDSYRELCLQLIKNIEEYYAQMEKKKSESIKLDEELKRNLKALGYIR